MIDIDEKIPEIIQESFTPFYLVDISDRERGILLKCISQELTLLSKSCCSLHHHQEILYKIIERLKNLKHDIWRWEYNCEEETWGGDYMRPLNAGKLVVHSEFPGKIKFQWRSWPHKP